MARRAVPLRAAVDGAVFDCLHVDRRGKCVGYRLRGDGVNLLGIFITLALVALLLNRHRDVRSAFADPGHRRAAAGASSSWVGSRQPVAAPWAKRQPSVLGYTDRGSILLVVYAAFSAAVVAGAWSSPKPIELLRILLVSIVLLAIVLLATHLYEPRPGLPEKPTKWQSCSAARRSRYAAACR